LAHGNNQVERLKRNDNLRAIHRLGRKTLKENSGCHVRSLAETTIFRFKTIFGDRLSARLLEGQNTQSSICCAALNRMPQLGMPESYIVSSAGVASQPPREPVGALRLFTNLYTKAL